MRGRENVTLLKPVGEEGAYYATYGWAALSGVTSNLVPTPDTLWEVNGNNRLTVSSPVELVWDNGAGLKFSRVISIDEDYLFTVKQNVENTSEADVELRPYGLIRRAGEPKDVKNFFILHEGLVRMSDGELAEDSYKNMRGYDTNEREGTAAKRIEVTTNGWVGFTDHFWMTTLIPTPGSAFRSTAKYYEQADIYQAETVLLSSVFRAVNPPVWKRSFSQGPKNGKPFATTKTRESKDLSTALIGDGSFS